MLKNEIVVALFLMMAAVCLADTFTHKTTGQTFDGYLTSRVVNDLVVARSTKGIKRIDPNEYNIERNLKGRNKQIIAIKLDDAIMYEAETDAFIEAIEWSVDRGPMFIVIEVDSPGGRIDLCDRMCTAIIDTNSCYIYSYVGGGKNAGAYSAAAAVALSCDKVYMTADAAIGAATPYMKSEHGKVIEVDPNFMEAFSNFFGAIAQENGKPGIAAAAMVDNSIEVVEIEADGKPKFVSGKDVTDKSEIVKTWSQSGKLMTIPAIEANYIGLCDYIVDDLDDMMVQLGAEQGRILYNRNPQKARLEVQQAEKRVDITYSRVVSKYKKFATSEDMTYSNFYHTYHALIRDIREAIALTEKYPDLKQHQHLPGLREYLEYLESALKK